MYIHEKKKHNKTHSKPIPIDECSEASLYQYIELIYASIRTQYHNIHCPISNKELQQTINKTPKFKHLFVVIFWFAVITIDSLVRRYFWSSLLPFVIKYSI